MQFVTVRTFDNYIKANLVLQQLEEEGIHAFLQDENTVTIDPMLSNAIGGIKLTVPQPEVEKANELLAQIDKTYREAVTCPLCGSHDVHYVTKKDNAANWLTAIATFALGSYAMATKYVYRCFKCNHEFDEMPEQ